MVEKCLVLATMAVLVCHPKSTIKCFNPSTATSPHRKTSPSPKPPYHNNHASKVKSKTKQQSSSLSKRSCRSNVNIVSPPVLSSPPTSLRLVEKGPSISIVEKIFRSGWNKKKSFRVENVLKVSPRLGVIARFDKYRKVLESKSSETSVSFRMQRPITQGNEVLRFLATTVTCSLGNSVVSGTCNKKCCGVCRMIESNFSDRERSVSFYDNSWEAHLKLKTDYVASRAGAARKAMIVCSVIAGDSGRRHGCRLMGAKGCSDTVIASSENQSDALEDLVVRKPKAVLPCFVLIYNAR